MQSSTYDLVHFKICKSVFAFVILAPKNIAPLIDCQNGSPNLSQKTLFFARTNVNELCIIHFCVPWGNCGNLYRLGMHGFCHFFRVRDVIP